MSNFWLRIITGTVFIAVVLSAIWFGPITFQVLFLWIALLAADEFYRISKESLPSKTTGLILAAVTYIIISATAFSQVPDRYTALIFPVAAIVFFVELYRKHEKPFLSVAVTMLGVLYAALPFALLNKIAAYGLHYNRSVIIGYFVLLWSSDSFAYVWGRMLGRRKLFERVSPGKTWEGCIGGTITTLGVAYLLYHFNPETALMHWLVIALIICITGVYGDLVESMLKRSLGIKDSGTFLPGHGGLLDRFDGLLLSVPFVWCYLALFA